MKLKEKQKHFNKGIELFNSQKFYEAHEEWETIWLQERGELRNFYQGLIILAGAMHHVQKWRFGPAKKALEKSFAKLSEYRSYPKGAPFRGRVYMRELLEQVDNWQKLLENPTHFSQAGRRDWPQLHGQWCHK